MKNKAIKENSSENYNDVKQMGNLKALEKTIKYSFKNKKNLILALTHSSYANENKDPGKISNERIEFLGDSILNIAITEYLYLNYPEFSEGEMTKIRANIVCEASLAICAKHIKLGNYLFLGKGEKASGGKERDSLLSDAFEALIGAIYLDTDIESSKKFILDIMEKSLNLIKDGDILIDYKTDLQERLQKNSDVKISYIVIDEIGPDHKKTFISEVLVNDIRTGLGKGKSKKESEQNAAKEALEDITEEKYDN